MAIVEWSGRVDGFCVGMLGQSALSLLDSLMSRVVDMSISTQRSRIVPHRAGALKHRPGTMKALSLKTGTCPRTRRLNALALETACGRRCSLRGVRVWVVVVCRFGGQEEGSWMSGSRGRTSLT